MTFRQTLRRAATATVGLSIAAGFGLTAGLASAVVAAPLAASASTVGGSISASEVLARAQYWVNQGYVYSPNAPTSYSYSNDASGKSYRDDCSGLVSEAWHLSTSYTTADFNVDNSLWHTIPWDSMQPGDAYVRNDSSEDHIELFVNWVDPSDHSKGLEKYSFNSNGYTVENPYALNNVGKSGHASSPQSGFHAIRYNKISSNIGDFDSDGKPDIIGLQTSTNNLLMYTTNGTSTVTGPSTVGTNFFNYDEIVRPGDFDGDGIPDLLARNKTDHDLYLFSGTGTGTVHSGVDISNNWSAMDQLSTPGDFDGDGHNDLIARNTTTGALMLYRGNGAGGFAGTSTIGTGWTGMDLIMSPGDFNGDGRPDVLARSASTGQLLLYPGTGTGLGSSSVAGTNWSGMKTIIGVGDVDGDGNDDLVAYVTSTSNLLLYSGNGAGGFKSGSSTIGSNWSSFTTIL